MDRILHAALPVSRRYGFGGEQGPNVIASGFLRDSSGGSLLIDSD